MRTVKKSIYTATIIVLAGIIYGFTALNGHDVPVSYSFQQAVTTPLYIPVLAAATFGYAGGCLIMWIYNVRYRTHIRRQARRIRMLEKQLTGTGKKRPPARYRLVRHNYAETPRALLEKIR